MTTGIGSLALQFALGQDLMFAIEGVALAAVLGIILNLVLPEDKS